MRTSTILIIITACLIFQAPKIHAGLGDIVNTLEKTLAGENISESKMIQGLKQALEIGTATAVEGVSKVGGYQDNPKIKIPLPAAVTKVEKVLRASGFGSQLDAFEQSMNRAAEQAAPHAKSLFLDAVKSMSFDDASRILKGRENEATLYFEDKTRGQLMELFKPLVHNTMSETGVTKYYQDLKDRVQKILFTNTLYVDLDQYVTDRALDGLFLMIAEEEQKIREDPAARVTQLLKDVFGKAK
jgi:hypothetical protein